jgi:hypothetical protein
MMRTVTSCLLLASAVLTPQQSSSELHSLYGQSDLERFRVRPGITLTVEYGPDRTACRMVIEGLRHLPSATALSSVVADKILPQDEVDQILAEVAVPGGRGVELRQLGGFSTGGAYVYGEEYEHLVITHVAPHDCPSVAPHCEARAYVTFKREPCDSLQK